MSNRNDNTIGILNILKFRKRNTIFMHRISLTCPRINNNGSDLILSKTFDNILYLGISCVGAVFLKRQTEDDNFRLLRCLSNGNHIFNSSIGNKFTHRVINNSTIENNLAVITEFFCLICKIVWVNANAVTANKTGTETKSIPFGIHTINNFVGINIHLVKSHCKLVHKCNIDVTLAVLNNFNSFCCSQVAHRVSTNFYNDIIYRFNGLESFFVTTRYNLGDVFKSMYFVSGIDSFGRISDLKIHATLQSGLSFQNRNTNILRATRIYCRFKHNVRTLGKISTYDFRSSDNRSQIRGMVCIHRSRHSDNVELGFLQISFMRSKENLSVLNSIISDFFCRINSVFIQFNFSLIEIKSNNINTLICKSNGNRHTYIAKTYKRQLFFIIDNFVIKRHFIFLR